MELTVSSTFIENIVFQSVEELNEESEFSFSKELKFYDDKKMFSIIFELELNNGKGKLLNMTYLANFKTSEEIGDDFIHSPFPKINAPAIVFPYLRVAVTNIFVLSGYSPVYLPSINFVALEQQESKK